MLLKFALDKIALLPWGLLVDHWRWQVVSDNVAPEQYNQSWWELGEKYQGVTTLTGQPDMDASTAADYFIPLKSGLDEKN